MSELQKRVGGQLAQPGHRLGRRSPAEKTQQPGDFRAHDFFRPGIDIPEKRYRCAGSRLVNPLQGGELDRLVVQHAPRREIGADHLQDAGHGREAKTDF